MQIKQKLLEALKAYLSQEKVTWSEPISVQEWMDFFHVATTHSVLPMVYEAVYDCPAMLETGKNVAAFYKRQIVQMVVLQTTKTAEFVALYQQLVQAGLKPLVVKGIICRSLYPNPDYRISGDEDIILQPEQFPTCHELFLRNGLAPCHPEQDVFQETEVAYQKAYSPLYIELHKELFPSTSQAYGDFNQLFQGAFDRAIQQKVEGVDLYTLDHSDFFLYLICHAFKHFMHSGFGIRQVCDVVVYANAFGPDLDWMKLLSQLRTIHADLFTAALLQIGSRYLNFDPQKACYPQAWQEIAVDCEALLDDLISGGVYGSADRNRQHSSTITLNAVAADKHGKSSKPNVLKSLFPPAKDLVGRYPYLAQKPYLLPVAWLSRIAQYEKETHETNSNAMESIQIGQHRVDLLRQYGIIK